MEGELKNKILCKIEPDTSNLTRTNILTECILNTVSVFIGKLPVNSIVVVSLAT